MKHQFEKCRDRGKIIQVTIDSQLVEKELQESRYDVNAAQKSIEEGNHKWAIVQSYYSMFHAFRGLLFSRGFREKSHICLKFAIEALFVDNNIISEDILDDFDFARKARERADYSYVYDEKLANDILETARKLISEVESLL